MKNNFSNFFDRLRGKDQETQVVVSPEEIEPVEIEQVSTLAAEPTKDTEEANIYGEVLGEIRDLLKQLLAIETEKLTVAKRHHQH